MWTSNLHVVGASEVTTLAEVGTNESNADSLTVARTQAMTRRETRLARDAAPAPRRQAAAPAPAAPRRRWGSTVAVALAVPALFGTVALPAYAINNNTDAAGTSLQDAKEAGAQAFTAPAADEASEATAVSREGYTATSDAEIAQAAQVAAASARAEQAAAGRSQFAAQQAAYSGPSASDLLSTSGAAMPDYSLSAVFSEALKYQGVPYVFGGATPAGFDCSGFVKYVFAKFGINMPHNSTTQGNMGKKIAVADAVPGDLVVSAGHIGFYAGNGMILHASQPGTPLRIGPIYAKNWSIVRVGI